jgi:hypothetical protein
VKTIRPDEGGNCLSSPVGSVYSDTYIKVSLKVECGFLAQAAWILPAPRARLGGCRSKGRTTRG